MKYEDGPCVSFRSKEKRLEGEWSLKYFTVDGDDSLEYWNNYFGNECTFIFNKWSDLGYYPFTIEWGFKGSNYYFAYGSHLGFHDEFLGPIGFTEDTANTAFPFLYVINTNEWLITRLKYKEVWLELTVNLKHYELHLENLKKI